MTPGAIRAWIEALRYVRTWTRSEADRDLRTDRESSRRWRCSDTLMYLMLSVASHLTSFLTRARGPSWSILPARTLLLAVSAPKPWRR